MTGCDADVPGSNCTVETAAIVDVSVLLVVDDVVKVALCASIVAFVVISAVASCDWTDVTRRFSVVVVCCTGFSVGLAGRDVAVVCVVTEDGVDVVGVSIIVVNGIVVDVAVVAEALFVVDMMSIRVVVVVDVVTVVASVVVVGKEGVVAAVVDVVSAVVIVADVVVSAAVVAASDVVVSAGVVVVVDVVVVAEVVVVGVVAGVVSEQSIGVQTASGV